MNSISLEEHKRRLQVYASQISELERETLALKATNHILMGKLQATMSFLVDYANSELDEQGCEEDLIIEELQA